MDFFAGIDNSSLDHKVRIVNEKGAELVSMTISNDLSGFNQLNNKLCYYSGVNIGFELPHGPIVDYLKAKNYCMYSLNPLKIKRYKESLVVSGNKTDTIDALAIAEYLRNNKSATRELLFNSSHIEKLKTLSIIHTRLTQNNARHLNKLHFTVRQYFPLHEALFSSFGSKVQLQMIIAYPTCKDLKTASQEKIKDFLIRNRYRRTKDIEKILYKIENYSQMISEDIEYAYKFESRCLCTILLTIKNELQEIENEMEEITENHTLGKYFQSLPGAGKVLSAKLLALFGDNKNRFHSANEAQCLFGTAPKNYQSGQYHKIIMRKACNKTARAIVYKFAFASLQFSNWAREYYDQQRKKGKTHSVAVRALSNKWVKIIYCIWKNEVFYDEMKKSVLVA